MNRGVNILAGVLGVMALMADARALVPTASGSGDAAVSATPYQSIWLRNVFDLKPTTVAVVEAPNNTPPPPNIKLTGITTILGNKRALFMVQEAAVPGKPAGAEESYILSEGQRRGRLEVLEINPKAMTVKIKNDDILATITFPSNNIAAGAPSPVVTGIPRSVFHRAPDASPGFSPGNNFANPGSFPIPGRQPRTSYNPSDAAPSGGYVGGYAGGYVGAVAAPVSTPGVPPPNVVAPIPTPASNPSQPDVMSQAAAALAQAQARAASQGHSLMPDVPVYEGIPDLPATTTTTVSSSMPSGNVPIAPHSLIVPPVPNLPVPPTLPPSLQPQ